MTTPLTPNKTGPRSAREQLIIRLEEEAAAASPERAALVRYELGRLLAGRKEDRDRAAEVLDRASSFAPAARESTRLRLLGGDAAALIPALEAEEEAALQDEVRAAILVERALVRLTETGEEEQALDELRRALRLAPGHMVATVALSERLEQSGRTNELEQLYREQARACGDGSRQAELLFLAGRARENEPDSTEEARELYGAALKADPDHDGARFALLRLQRRARRWDEVAASLETLAGGPDRPDAASLLREAAAVHLDHLQAPVPALACLKRAIHLADRQARGPLLMEVARLLCTLEGREAEAAAAFTEARLSLGDDREAARALLGLARLRLDQLEDLEQGLDDLAAALDLDPDLEPARALLRAAAADHAQHDRLAAHYQADLDHGGPRGWRAGLLLGHLRHGAMADPAGAVEAFQQTLALRPGWRPALLGLGAAQRAAGEPELAMATYEAQLLELRLSEEKVRALEHVAEIAEHELDDLARAAGAHERILSLEPGWAISRVNLIRLYQSLGRWPQLASILRASLERTDNTEHRIQLLDQLAWVYTCRLEDRDAALEAYLDLIELCPDHLPAWYGAITLLGAAGKGEERLDLLLQLKSASTDPRAAALAGLRAAWTRGHMLGQWAEAARAALEIQLPDGDAGDPAARLLDDLRWTCQLRCPDQAGALLQASAPTDTGQADAAVRHRSMARGFVAAGMNEEAREHLVRALKLDPAAAGAHRGVSLLCNLEGSARRLATHLQARAEALPPGPDQDEIFLRLLWLQARTATATGADAASGHELLERATSWSESLPHRRLVELFLARQQEWTRLADLLSSRPPTPDFSSEETTLALVHAADQMVAAELHEGLLDDLEAAAHLAFSLLERHPNNEEALALLERHYRAAGNEASLVEILSRRLEGLSHAMDRATHLEAVGSACARARDMEGAASHLRQAVEIQASSLTAARRWAAACEALERAEEQCQALAAEATASRVQAHQAAATLKAAELWRERQGDAHRAIAAYRQLLRMDPDNREASDALMQVLEEEEAWPTLVELLLQEAARDPARRRNLLEQAARVSLEELGDSAGASTHLRAALEEDPSDPELWTDLAAACRAAGDWHGLVQANETLLGLEPGREPTRDLRLELARVLHERLDRLDDAAEQLARVLELTPHNKDALARLVEIHTRQEAWPQAAGTIQALLDQEHRRERLVDLHLRQARILDLGLNDPGRAAEACKRALAHDPGHMDAIRRLADLLGRQGSVAARELHLRSSLEVHRQRAERDPSYPPAYLALADMLRAIKDPDGARVMEEIVCALEPGATPAPRTAPSPPASALTGEVARALAHPDIPPPLLQLLERARPALTRVYPRTAETRALDPDPGANPAEVFLRGQRQAMEQLGLDTPAGLLEEELGKLVASLLHLTCHLFNPPYPLDELEPLRADLDRALDQGIRRALASPALELSDHAFAPARWLAAMVYTGDRLGLISCGSPLVALTWLRQLEGGPAGPGEGPWHPGERAQQLLRFAIGDTYLRLRRPA